MNVNSCLSLISSCAVFGRIWVDGKNLLRGFCCLYCIHSLTLNVLLLVDSCPPLVQNREAQKFRDISFISWKLRPRVTGPVNEKAGTLAS
jgi:hypothetical protein